MTTYKFTKKEWKKIEEADSREDSIQLPSALIKKLKRVKKDLDNDLDVVIIIVGDVGSGKSTLGRLCCRYVSNETFNPRKHMVRNVDDIKVVLQNAKKGDAVLFDEGSGIFGSTDTLTKKTKYANLVLDVCRQKNLFIVIIAPYFQRLGTSVAIDRSKFLLRTYLDKKTQKRGPMCYYKETLKEKLYYHIRKHGTLKGIKPTFRSKFGRDDTQEEVYKKMKDETLNIVLDSFNGKDKEKPLSQTEIIRKYRLSMVKNNMKTPIKHLATSLGVTERQISLLKQKIRKYK